MVFTSIPLGILGDRYEKRKFVIMGNILASVTMVMFALTTDTVLLFLAAMIEGLSEGGIRRIEWGSPS